MPKAVLESGVDKITRARKKSGIISQCSDSLNYRDLELCQCPPVKDHRKRQAECIIAAKENEHHEKQWASQKRQCLKKEFITVFDLCLGNLGIFQGSGDLLLIGLYQKSGNNFTIRYL